MAHVVFIDYKENDFWQGINLKNIYYNKIKNIYI
jgi:hypothetical protein